MDIGKAIKKLRKELTPKLTQHEYAKIIGITQAYLSQVETGKKKPSIEVLEKISKDSNTPLPIMFWFAIDETDISEDKQEYFKLLKPSIDKMIESIL